MVGLPFVVSGLAGCSSDRARPEADVSFLEGPFRVPPGPVVAEPAADPDDNVVVRTLVERVRHVPEGELVRIVGLSFSHALVADALLAAHARGVRVQVLLDGRASRDFAAVARLTDALGSDRRAPSYVRLTRGSARGGATELHQKTWMFSRTGDSRRVVMVGSTNLTSYSAGQYTDMWTFVDRARVWRAFSGVYADQVRDRPLSEPFRAEDLGRGERAWFYPGATTATDPALRLLARVPAEGSRIRVLMYAWYGARGRLAAEALADLARGGAAVTVVHGKAFGSEVERILGDAGIQMHRGVWSDDGDDVHCKLLLVDQPDGRGGRERVVQTGSDNFGDGGYARDEVVVQVRPTVAQYRVYSDFADALVARAVATDR